MDKKKDNWVEDTINQAFSSSGSDTAEESVHSDIESEQLSSKCINEQPEQASHESDNKKKKKSAKGKVIFVLVLLLVLIGGAGWLVYDNFAVVGDMSGIYEIYSRSITEIDLSGSDITDFSGLKRLDKVKKIDLTNTSVDDLSVLYDCDSLETVILYDKVLPAKQCVEFYDLYPDADLICSISVGDEVYSSHVEKVTISDSDLSADSIKLLAALHYLKELDLSGCRVSDDTYDYLNGRLPECNILRMVQFNGSMYLSNVDELVLTSDMSESEIERLKYFPSLGVVDARECENTELADKVGEMYPQVKINRSMTFLNVKVGSADEVIDLRGKKYSLSQVKAALDENLNKFSNLKKIDMCGCGLTNEEMEELTASYPDIKFVWIIKFGRWKVRTDAIVFSALNGNGSEFYNEKHYAKLFKYCTDLMALDLGHSLIVDISAISNLKNLRAVILTDNKISDISSFAELKDLEFIEMNVNRVKSVEPLKDLSNLKYINLWSSRAATDLSSLYNHENLKLVIFHKTVSQEERQRFVESNPNCQTFFTVDTHKNLSTNVEWRSNQYRIDLKTAFANWKKVVGWSEETGFVYDQNTDQYSIM